MSIALVHHRYGKSNVRLVKLVRRSEQHQVIELSVSIALEGDFDAAHEAGDNSLVLPTDTMKNTVYVLAQDHPLDSIESFAIHLCEHFRGGHESVSAADVEISATNWHRMTIAGRPQPGAFERGTDERSTCHVRIDQDEMFVESGISDLVIMKTSGSGFEGYRVDDLTTLSPTGDRILATSLSAQWTYRADATNWNDARASVRSALLETFAGHESKSVQHTLHAMAGAAIEACDAVSGIGLSMPNKHCLLVDLSPFDRSNDNEIFLPIDEPFGLIEAWVERRKGDAD